MILSSILFVVTLLLLGYFFFTNFSFFLSAVYPFVIFLGSYITIGNTSIHVAEFFVPLLLIKNPFSKRFYSSLDLVFVLFFIVSWVILSFNSDFDFLYLKTIIRFFEIVIVYFIYSKYHSLIKLFELRRHLSKVLILLLLISSINLIYISFYDSYSWMKLLIELGYIPKGVESFGYLDSWSNNNSVQGNFLIEHQYGIMLVSCLFLSSSRFNYRTVIPTLFFLFFGTFSTTIQFSLLVSLVFYFTQSRKLKTFLYLLIFSLLSFSLYHFWDQIKVIYYQIYFLFKFESIVEVSSGFIRLSYIFKGFSDPSFHWFTGIGLDIFRNEINPHEILTYFYFLYGLPTVFIFLWIFYKSFRLKSNNPSVANLTKSYFIFAFIASFGINYFTSIVTFFPFILFLNYHKFIFNESSNPW